MPGEKMLKAIESSDKDNSKKIDANELHDAFKDLDKGEISRGLKHKVDKIKAIDGIHDATRDLLTKINSDPVNLQLSKDQLQGLHALHVLLNPDLASQDGSKINIKKLDKTLNKSEVIDDVYAKNVQNVVEYEDSSYVFYGWEKGANDTSLVGSAEVLDDTTMYFIPFTLDGKIDFSKGTSTIPGSVDVVARGFDGKALPNAEKKVAYIQNGKLTIEKSDSYAKKMKNKEFVEKLENVTVPGLFLTKLLETGPEKGNMKVAYLSDAAILDIVSTGKHGLTKFQKEYDAAISPLLSISNANDRIAKIDAVHKGFLPKYKDYIKENSSVLMDILPATDVFTVDMDSKLVDPVATTKLTIDGKKEQEEVNNYKSLDGGNIIVSIDKTGNTTSWNIYTKKEDGKSYGVDKTQQQIDPNAPVTQQDKPKDVIPENKDLLDKINALTDKFMFTGGSGSIVDKDTAVAGVRSALRKLSSDPTKKDITSKIVDNLTAASQEINKSESQRKLIMQVQIDLNANVNGIAGSTDGYRGQKTQDALLVFAGLIKKQPEKSPTPKPTNTPSSAPKSVDTKKQPIDALATERKQLADLQEKAKNDVTPLLKKLVPTGTIMQDYIRHLPATYTQQLTLLDQTLTMDPKAISDKVAFEKSYQSMSINVENLTSSLNALSKRQLNDFFNNKETVWKSIDKAIMNLVTVNGKKVGSGSSYLIDRGNDWSSSLGGDTGRGYIKYTTDPENGSLSSWFAADFLNPPKYNNGSRVITVDEKKLDESIQDRIKQKRGETPNLPDIRDRVFA